MLLASCAKCGFRKSCKILLYVTPFTPTQRLLARVTYIELDTETPDPGYPGETETFDELAILSVHTVHMLYVYPIDLYVFATVDQFLVLGFQSVGRRNRMIYECLVSPSGRIATYIPHPTYIPNRIYHRSSQRLSSQRAALQTAVPST